jgi:hypothetical protein
MSHCELRTPWPIHFKLRTVIGIDSLTVCILFGEISNSATYEKSPTIWWIKFHNSGMKNWNFTKKYTDRKTIYGIPLSVCPFHMSHSNLRTPWPIHFKFHRVIGIYGLTVWWNFNFSFQSWNFTKRYTDRKTINSNNYAKFEVNWPRGSQFTVRHTKNRLQFDE